MRRLPLIAIALAALLSTSWAVEEEPRKDDFQGWKFGPLPADTYHYGAIVLVGEDAKGFEFAEFKGDYALIKDSAGHYGVKQIKRDQIAYFNNSIVFPFAPNK